MSDVRTVWKFDVTEPGPVSMPKGAQILHFGAQPSGGSPTQLPVSRLYVWALVDPNAETEERLFAVVGTGQEWREDPTTGMRHVGSTQDGPFVWHLFEGIQ
jgi:hypothetical protein